MCESCTDFEGSLTAAIVGTGLIDFLAVCEVLLAICLLMSLYYLEVVVLSR
jgi:hypothetical protein